MSNIPSNDFDLSRFETSRAQIFRERKTPQMRQQLFFEGYGWLILLTFMIAMLILPALTLPLSMIAIVVVMLSWSVVKGADWLLRKPIYEYSEKERQNLSREEKRQLGMVYMGKQVGAKGKELWFSPNELVTHVLAFGSTGSGKTEFVLGVIEQFMHAGSGFIFCDGKGDVSTWFLLYNIARQLGLEDNLLVLNFLTAGGEAHKKTHKISHTLNPFSRGSSDTLMEMLSGFMGSSGNDSAMWRGRAEALGRCLMRALCELRDLKELELSIETIREAMPLAKLEELAHNPKLSDFAKQSIYHYLNELPGWAAYKEALKQNTEEAQIAANEAKKTAYEQHAYLTMQFTKTLEMLAGTYAHITKTDLAEIDFKDVITNRRFLYIMLPSLEKSPESLRDLGRIIVTNIRNVLSGELGGHNLSGSKEDILDTKATQSIFPFGIFCDEYGSYAVDGFGDTGAQSRSINVSMWFLGQDYDSFQKASPLEAARLESNALCKIFMKGDSKNTAAMAEERAGETYVFTANQINRQGDLSEKTQDSNQYQVEKVKRVTREDLVAQKAGECQVFYGEHRWHINAFYGEYKPAQKTQLNEFMKLYKTNTKICTPSSAKPWYKEAITKSHPDQMSQLILSHLTKEQTSHV